MHPPLMSEIVGSGRWEIGKMSKLQKSGAREEINLSPLTDLLLAPVRVTSYCSGNKRAAVILWKSQSPMLCSISFSPPIEGNLPISSFAPMPKFKHSTYVMIVIHTVRHGTFCEKFWNDVLFLFLVKAKEKFLCEWLASSEITPTFTSQVCP